MPQRHRSRHCAACIVHPHSSGIQKWPKALHLPSNYRRPAYFTQSPAFSTNTMHLRKKIHCSDVKNWGIFSRQASFNSGSPCNLPRPVRGGLMVRNITDTASLIGHRMAHSFLQKHGGFHSELKQFCLWETEWNSMEKLSNLTLVTIFKIGFRHTSQILARNFAEWPIILW